jgi:beta-glucosidase
LLPGEKASVHFNLDPRDLSWVDPEGNRLVSAGDFGIFVGSAQPAKDVTGASGRFSIRGTQKLSH